MKIIGFEIEINGVNKVISDIKSLDEAIKLVNEALKSGPQFGSAEYKKLVSQLGALKQIQKEIRDETKQQGREFAKNKDLGRKSYRALNAELVNLRNRYKELSEEERKSSIGKGILKSIKALDAELKKIDAELGNFQRNVGNYKSALTSLGDVITGGLITGGLFAIFSEITQFVSNATQISADFERKIGFLGQVSGAAFETIQVEGRGAVNVLELLRETALELGATTEFTASQVADLQVAYAKLGFTSQEILNLLRPTIDTATIAGEELGRVAEVIGTTVRAFGLSAEEGSRVADVLAKAFSSSALDISKFETALATVGASGNAVGLTLEEVVALLATLIDAGFDASTAATSLRNIFLENSKAGLTLDQALQKVSESTNALVTADEAYGKRGAAQAVILAAQVEKTKQLTETLQESANFSKESASVVRDDLKGAFDALRSAVESLQLAFVDLFGDVLKDFVLFIAQIVRGISGWLRGTKELSSAVKNFVPSLGLLLVTVRTTSTTFSLAAIRAIPAYIAALIRGSAVVRAFTAVQASLNAVMRANPIGLIISGIALLISAFVTAYQRSLEFRAAIQGILNVSLEFFSIIKDGFVEFSNALGQLARGEFKKAAESFGNILAAANPINAAAKQGARLAKAYSEGYKSVIEKEARQQKVETVETEEIIDTTKTQENIEKEKIETIRVLRQFKADIEKELQNAIPGTVRYEKLTADLAAVNERIKNLTQDTAKILGNTIAGLKERKKQLNEQLENLVPGTLEFKLVAKEIKKIDDQLKQIKRSAETSPTKRLQNELSDLKEKIQDAIVSGRDYSSLLERYEQLSLRAARAQEEFKNKVEAVALANLYAEGSIERLNSEVNRLNDEISKAPPELIPDLSAQLADAQEKLRAAKDNIERFRRSFDVTEVRSTVLETDIEPTLRAIELERNARLQALEKLSLDEEKYQQQRKLIELRYDAEIIQQKIQLYKEGTAERAALETEYQEKINELAKFGQEEALNVSIASLRARRDANLRVLREQIKDDELYEARKKILEEQTQIEILRLRLDYEKLSAEERFAIELELAERQKNLQKEVLDAQLKNNKLFSKEFEKGFKFVFDNVSAVIDDVIDFGEAATERRIQQVNVYYEREIELAQGNADEIAKLEEERDKKIEQIERAQFERHKRLQIAQALIGGAQAIVATLAAPPGPADIVTLGTLRAIQIALITATTAAQIAKITSQTFAKGGFTGKSMLKPDSTGERPVGIVHEHEYVVPKKVLRTPEGRTLVNKLEQLRIGKRVQQKPNIAPAPVIVTASTRISDSQIENISNEISKKVFAAVIEGMRLTAQEQALIHNRFKKFKQ